MSTMTSRRRQTLTCLEGGTAHAWENLGLDIVRGELRSVKRCVWCRTERASQPKPHPQRHYVKTS